METTGIVEVVRKQQQDWGEMRNGMLAEREIGKQNSKKINNRVMKREEKETDWEKGEVLKWANQRRIQMSGNSRPRPPPHLTSSHPSPTLTQPEQSSLHLCTIKPTLLVTIRRNRRKRRSPTQLPLTANPLPPGGSKPRDGQKGKEVVKGHTVCAWGTRLVWLPAEGPLKP